MCGINGILLNKSGISKKILQQCNKVMRHRGPDDEGVWISDDKKTGFSHVRLSIVDLDERSAQPFHIGDDITLVYNGEIYNYLELRKQLEKKYVFRTTSDTEVLGYLYLEHGRKLLEKIEGMFAFAIHDHRTGETLLARDIVGQKPLVYHESKEGFYFASEIPVLLEAKPSLADDIDYTALRLFLSDKFHHIPQPFTAYKHIRKLKPAHYMIVKDGKVKAYKQYYRLRKRKQQKIDDVELIESIIDQMRPHDVGYASFLSGGVDSSLVCATLQKYSQHKVDAYTLTTKNEDPDYKRAAYVAKEIGLRHHKITYNPKKLEQNVAEEIAILGEPYFHITTVYTDQILEEVAKQHKVIFTGSGGDEAYYGYDNRILLALDIFLRIQRLLPKAIWKVILPQKYHYLIGASLADAKKRIYLESYCRVDAYPDKEDLGEEYIEEIAQDINNFAEIKNFVELSYISGLIVENSHSLTIPADLAGMKHSIEIRNPFLEKRLIERAFSIPLFRKTNLWRLHEGKEILRKALLRVFPRSFVYGKKYGFGTELKVKRLKNSTILNHWRRT